MRYWLLTSEYPPIAGGGIATYSYHTAQMLSQRGHEVTVIVGQENIDQPFRIDTYSNNLRVATGTVNQKSQRMALGKEVRISYDIAQIVKTLCLQDSIPDIIESQDYLGIAYFTLLNRAVLEEPFIHLKLLLTAHTPLFVCNKYNQIPRYLLPYYWIGELEQFCFRATDGIIFPSNYLEQEITILKYDKRIWTIPNPYQILDNKIFLEQKICRKGFIYVGRLERRKGILLLLDTFKHLWDLGFDEPLILIGDDWFDILYQRWMGGYIKNIYKKYFDKGLLIWEGAKKQEEINKYFFKVRALIMPSVFENFPYVVLEAMSCECIVIVSSSGGHAEIVKDNITGFVYSWEKPHDLESKIYTIINLSQNEVGRITGAAQKRVWDICNYDSVGPKKELALNWIQSHNASSKYFPFSSKRKQYFKKNKGNNTTIEENGLLSIVIPYHNMSDYIEETFKSLTNFQGVKTEILVIDNGSDENNRKTLDNLQKQYQFRLERQNEGNLPNARNYGANLAKGEFLAFLDADDLIDPIFYLKAISIFRRYKEVSYVGCWAEYFGDARGYWPAWIPELPYILIHNLMVSGALIYRRLHFLNFGMNDPSFILGMEDYDSLLSLIENGCLGVIIPEPFLKYRIRRDSMLHKMTKLTNMITYERLAHKHEQLFRDHVIDIVGILNENGPGYNYDNPTFNQQISELSNYTNLRKIYSLYSLFKKKWISIR